MIKIPFFLDLFNFLPESFALPKERQELVRVNYAINRDNISKADIDNENKDGAGGASVKWTVHTLRKYLQSRGF